MKKKNPLISVIMPVYNGEKYLVESMESILQQTFQDFELIIINDCSIDKTKDILLDYQSRHSNIPVITNEHNLGIVSSLNKGINYSSGKYIARMDADDVSLPTRFEIQADFMQSHPEIGILGSQANFINGKGEIIGKTDFPVCDNLIRWAMCYYCALIHPTIIMRKYVIDKLGGYRSSHNHAEDYELWSRAANLTKFSNINIPLLNLRKHINNISYKFQKKQLENAKEISRLFIMSKINMDVKTLPFEFLANPRKITKLEIGSLSKLVKALLKEELRKNNLSYKERRYLKKYSSKYLFNFSSKSKYIPIILNNLFYIFLTFPPLLLQELIKILRKIIDQREKN